jgi:hypothetical protein
MLWHELGFEIQKLFGDPKTEIEEGFHVDKKRLLELVARKIELGSFVNAIGHDSSRAK